ncbi:MAG: hypothetical protein R6X23_14070 [Acidimicrobiia bacterium]
MVVTTSSETPMDRQRQPATRPAARGTRRSSGRARNVEPYQGDDDTDDDWPEDRPAGLRALLHGFALVRWILLIFAVGFGVAAVIAIAFAALFALVNASV